MQLIHTEIDAVPGGNVLAPQPNGVRSNTQCGILRLHNNRSERVRAFRVYLEPLRPEHKARFRRWYRLVPQPPAATDTDAAARADDVEPGMVTIHIGGKQSRDIHLEFRMDATPEAEAGRYDFLVVIEAIPDAATPLGAKVPTKRLPGILYIHPFWEWGLQLEPQFATASWGRRQTRMTVEVVNRGNDWLYCQLQLTGGPQQMQFARSAPPTDPEQRKTVLIAVPPVQPGSARIVRRVSFDARPDKTPFVGRETPQQIAVTATRLQAPSVPPLPAAPEQVTNAVLIGAAEGANNIGNGVLAYRPIVSSDITEFFKMIAGNFKTILAAIAMTALAICGIALLVVNAMTFKIKLLGEPKPIDGGKMVVRVKAEKPPFWISLQGGASGMNYYYKEVNTEGQPIGDEIALQIAAPPPGNARDLERSPAFQGLKGGFKQTFVLAALDVTDINKNIRLYYKPKLFYIGSGISIGDVIVGVPIISEGCRITADPVGEDGTLTLVASGCEFDEKTRPKFVQLGSTKVPLEMVDKNTLRGKIPPSMAGQEVLLVPPFKAAKMDSINVPVPPPQFPTPTPAPTPTPLIDNPVTPNLIPTPTPPDYEGILAKLRILARDYYQNGFQATDVEDMEPYANQLVAMESQKAKVLGYATRALVQLANGELHIGEGNLKTVQKMLNDNSNLKEASTVVIYQMAQRAYFVASDKQAAKVKIEALINQTVQDSTPF